MTLGNLSVNLFQLFPFSLSVDPPVLRVRTYISSVCFCSTGRPYVPAFRFLAPCQRLRAIVCVLSALLRGDESSTCVCVY